MSVTMEMKRNYKLLTRAMKSLAELVGSPEESIVRGFTGVTNRRDA